MEGETKGQPENNVDGSKELNPNQMPTPAWILSEDNIKGKLVNPISEKRMTKGEIIVTLVYSLCFIIVAFLLLNPEVKGQINTHLKAHFDGYRIPYSGINTAAKFLDWFEEFLVNVYSTEYYHGRSREHTKNPTIGGSNNLITTIRLTQRRMKLTGDESHDFENFHPQVWPNAGFNPDTLSLQDGEDMAPYGPNNTYRYYYSEAMSGYRIFFDGLNGTLNDSLATLARIKNTSYIDMQTRAVYVIYSLYSPQAQIYSLVFHILIFSKTGSTTCQLLIYNFNERYYRGSGQDLFRAICEGIYVILLGLYAVQHVFSIIATFRMLQFEEDDNKFAQEQYLKHKEKLMQSKATFMARVWKVVTEKVIIGLKLVYVHLSNVWNLLDLVNIILGIIIVVLWLRFIVDFAAWTLTPAMVGQSWAPINTFFMNLKDRIYETRILAAFNLLIVFARILKYMGELIARVSVVFNSLDKAKSDIIHYTFLLLAVMLSFVFFVYIYFGALEEDYSTMDKAIRSLFQFMNWWYSCFNGLLTKNFYLGFLLFVAFMIIVVFILLNMFTGFLIRAFKEADIELKRRLEGRDIVTNIKKDFFIDKHPLIQLYELWVGTLGLFFNRYKTKQNQAEADALKYRTLLNINKDESKDFDIEYNPLASFVDEKSKLPLTSFYVEEKYNIERDKRCGRILYSGLIFLGFTIFYLCILYFQIRVDYGSVIVGSIRRRFVEGVTFKRSENSARYTFQDVNDWGTLAAWLSLVPLATAKEFSPEANSYNYMLGTEIKLSFRLGKTLPWSSQLDKLHEMLPNANNIDIEPQAAERTDKIVGAYSGTIYNYTIDRAYLGTGGYVLHWNITPAILAVQSTNFVGDGILGPDMWYLAIEAVMYQPVVAACVYSLTLFKFLKTGKFEKEFFAFPIPLGYFNSTRSIVRTVFEILVMAFVGFYVFTFCYDIIYKWREYDKWIEAQLPYFTPLQKYQRKQKSPEFLRKALYLFTIYRILDFIFFILFSVSIGFYIEVIARSKDMERSMPYDHTAVDYHNIIRKGVTAFLNYINYSSLAFLMLSLRLMEYLQFMGNMQVLTAALGRAQSDIFYYGIIFSSFMMGFAGMATLAFGEGCPDFRTIGRAWRSCFFMLLGEFDISDMLEENLGLTTLFMFVFLIFFSYVLINIFLAILEINFAESSEDYKSKVVSVRKLNAIKCCFLPDYTEKLVRQKEFSSTTHIRDFIETLNNFTINLKSKADSTWWWADDIAGDIQREFMRREQVAHERTNAILTVPGNAIRRVDDPTTQRAALKRAYMLHYLRVACQFNEFQNAAILYQCSLLDERIEANTMKFCNGRVIYRITDHYCQQVQAQRRNRLGKLIHTEVPLLDPGHDRELAIQEQPNASTYRNLVHTPEDAPRAPRNHASGSKKRNLLPAEEH